MWPFKKKKLTPNQMPIIMLHGIFQRLTFVHYPEIVFIVENINYDFGSEGQARIRIEARGL